MIILHVLTGTCIIYLFICLFVQFSYFISLYMHWSLYIRINPFIYLPLAIYMYILFLNSKYRKKKWSNRRKPFIYSDIHQRASCTCECADSVFCACLTLLIEQKIVIVLSDRFADVYAQTFICLHINTYLNIDISICTCAYRYIFRV